MSKKRGRAVEGFEEVDEAVEQLQRSLLNLERGVPDRLKALERVTSLVAEQGDEQYNVQRALVAGDAAFYLTECLSDAACAAKAADAVAAICSHSAAAVARLTAGPLVGLDSSVERVHLNPCQSDFVDSGALASLVPMLFQRQEAARDAATAAVAALCSYNQEGKLAYLEELVGVVQRGQQLEHAFSLLDDLIDGMECGSDQAAQQLDLLHSPLLGALRAAPAGQPGSQSGLSLLGTLCEKQAEAVEELRQQGGIAAVTRHLLQGSQVVQDVAARALWQLSKGQQQCLSDEAGLLGCDPLQLAQALVQLIEAAAAQEAAAEEEDAVGGAGSGDEAPYPGLSYTAMAAAGGEAEAAAVDLCHAEEAALMLHALAAAHPQVQQLAEEREVQVVRPSHCCVS